MSGSPHCSALLKQRAPLSRPTSKTPSSRALAPTWSIQIGWTLENIAILRRILWGMALLNGRVRVARRSCSPLQEQMQMMFALQELKQDFSGLYQKLCSTSITLEEAARAVTIQFENPRDKSDAVIAYRTRLARECYAAFPTSAPIQTAQPILDVTTLEAPPAPFLITDTPAPAPFMLATLPTPPCPTFETPSITVTTPVLEETLTPAPCPVAEAAVTAPVIEETPAPPPAPEPVYCEVGMTPAPCPTAQTPACTVVIPIIEDAMATAPSSSDNVIHCEDGMTPAPCPTVEAIRCEDGMTPAPCPTVEVIRCEDGMTPAPCPSVEASEDTLTAPPLSFLIPFTFLY